MWENKQSVIQIGKSEDTCPAREKKGKKYENFIVPLCNIFRDKNSAN